MCPQPPHVDHPHAPTPPASHPAASPVPHLLLPHLPHSPHHPSTPWYPPASQPHRPLASLTCGLRCPWKHPGVATRGLAEATTASSHRSPLLTPAAPVPSAPPSPEDGSYSSSHHAQAGEAQPCARLHANPAMGTSSPQSHRGILLQIVPAPKLLGMNIISRCIPPYQYTALSTTRMSCSTSTIYYMIKSKYKSRAKGRRRESHWGGQQNRAPRSPAGPERVPPLSRVLHHQCVQCPSGPASWRLPALP